MTSQQASTPHDEPQSHVGTQILVIDDNEPLRSIMRQMLETAGYEVAEAGNGREGMQRYQDTPAELIITDILMPEQEGLETIRALRHANHKVKIIAVTGGGETGALDFRKTAELLGAKRTLQKPFTRAEFLGAVREVLGA